MFSDKQIQRCTAYLELARTAMDNAELRICGITEHSRPGLSMAKACGEIAAAAGNLRLCVEEISAWAHYEIGGIESGATTDGAAAGNTVVPGQKT